MIERDYLMRLIALLTQFLARVLFHKKAYDYPQARQELQSAYKSLLGLTPEILRQFSDEQLMEMFGTDEDITATKSYVLGSLMKEEAEILRMEGDTDGGDRIALRSLNLLLTSYVSAMNEAEPGHVDKIEELIAGLYSAAFPEYVEAKLLKYYELTGGYAKAEDILFVLLDHDASWVTPGMQFYERLLKLPDEALVAGGLSRKEVNQAIEDLRRRT